MSALLMNPFLQDSLRHLGTDSDTLGTGLSAAAHGDGRRVKGHVDMSGGSKRLRQRGSGKIFIPSVALREKETRFRMLGVSPRKAYTSKF